MSDCQYITSSDELQPLSNEWLRSSLDDLQADLKDGSRSVPVSDQDKESLESFARKVQHYQDYGITAKQARERKAADREKREAAGLCLSSSSYLKVFLQRSPEYLSFLREKDEVERKEPLSFAEKAEIIRRNYPVVGYSIYEGGVIKIERAFGPGQKVEEIELEFDEDGVLIEDDEDEKSRGVITYWSNRSRSEMAFRLNACGVTWGSMLTVTYGVVYPKDGEAVKADLNAILGALRRRFKGVRYFWFLEFQRRGAPHVHILLDFEPTKADRQWWAKYWSRRQAKRYDLDPGQVQDVVKFNLHLKAWEKAKSKNGLRRYGVKYATKTEQKKVPEDYQNVGRFWGHWSGLECQKVGEVVCTEDELRLVLASERPSVAKWEIIPRYVFGFNLMEEGSQEGVPEKVPKPRKKGGFVRMPAGFGVTR